MSNKCDNNSNHTDNQNINNIDVQSDNSDFYEEDYMDDPMNIFDFNV